MSQASLAILPLLAGCAFVTGAGLRVLDPLLPMMAAELGTQVAGLASLIGAFALFYGGGQVLVGPLGDRLGKLRVLCVALFLYGAAVMGAALAGGLGALVALRAASGACAGAVFPMAVAWVADRVPYAQRQATLGRLLTGMVLAQLLTGPVSGAVGEAVGWRGSFLLLGAVALLLGVLLVRRVRGQPDPRGGGAGLGLANYAALARRPAARWLLVAVFCDGVLLFGGAFPYAASYLIERFGLSPATAGLVVAGFGVGALAYTRLAGRLLRMAGERGLVLAGGLTVAGLLALLAAAPDWRLIVPLQIALGLAFFCFHGVLQARGTEALPEARATAVGAFSMALFLGQSVGSLVFGALIGGLDYRAAFAVAAAGMLALTAWTRWRVLPSA